jgi:hypothetical protein
VVTELPICLLVEPLSLIIAHKDYNFHVISYITSYDDEKLHSTQIQLLRDGRNLRSTIRLPIEDIEDRIDNSTDVVAFELSPPTLAKYNMMGRYFLKFNHSNAQYNRKLYLLFLQSSGFFF